ncbi:MAG: SH3 domain-containing protein [Myxococcaceae bacterium]
MKNSLLIAAFALVACTGTVGNTGIDNNPLTGAPEDAASSGSALSGSYAVGSTLKTTANLNLRTGPSTSNSIRLVIPDGAHVTTVAAAPSNGWYNIKYNGTVGWSSGAYLAYVSAPPNTGGSTITSADRGGAILRAKSGVGFSYWWGHGAWDPAGVASSSAGACYGGCPSCTHSGTHGADCSGYVGKIWQVTSNHSLSVDQHPYSTASFVHDTSLWKTVSRSSLIKADALVYNSNGAGHIFLYESGDGWGSMWTYEAKGCSYGILHDLRTASSAYHGIRRAGY